MEYARVDLFAQDSVDQTILEGATFKVISADGYVTFGVFHSGLDGRAQFLLPVGTYEVRPYRFGAAFGSPRLIQVLPEDPIVPDGPILNTFSFKATRQYPDTPIDRRFCSASGYFRRATGGAATYLDMAFIAKFTPILLDGDAVLTERVETRTNDKGFAQVQLIRGAEYLVEVGGVEQMNRVIYVPDTTHWNLPDLIFPRVLGVDFDPTISDGGLVLSVGQVITVDAKAYLSDGRSLCGLHSYLCWHIVDPHLVAMEATSTGFRFRGMSVGTTSLVADRMASSILSIPNLPLVNTPVQLTVIP